MNTKNNIIIQIYKNPFDKTDFEQIFINEEIELITFLLKKYPKGFKNKTHVKLNDEIIKPVNFDIKLNFGDIVKIHEIPKEPVILTTFIIGYSYLIYRHVSGKEPDVPVIDSPSQELDKVKKSFSNRQSNLVKINEPIPSIYGKFRYAPDLVTSPYQYFEESTLVTEYLFSVGHGEHVIKQILSGNVNLLNNANVTTTNFSANQEITNTETVVYTVKEVQNTLFKSGALSRVNGYFNLHKSNKHIKYTGTQNPYYEFDTIFSEGDEIRIFCPDESSYNGVYEIASVSSNTITLVDASAWTIADSDDTIVIYKEGTYTNNPFYQSSKPDAYDNSPYMVKSTQTESFNLHNPLYEDVSIEFDFRADNGCYAKDGVYPVNYPDPTPLYGPAFWPNGGIILTYIQKNDDGTNKTGYYFVHNEYELVSSDGYTHYSSDPTLSWGNNDSGLSDYNFPTVDPANDYYFTANGNVIPESDINNIDWANGEVTFNTQYGGGEVKIHNLAEYIDDYIRNIFFSQVDNLPLYEGRVDGFAETYKYNNLFKISSGSQWSIPKNAEFVFRSLDSNIGFTELEDQVYIRSVKFIFPRQTYFPNVQVLKVKIKESNTSQVLPRRNIELVSQRKLITYNGSSWTAPAETSSIAWALADIWMSTYGASRSDTSIDLDKLRELDTLWSSRGDYFNGIFESSVSVWEALTIVARAGRAKPIFDETTLTFVRDEAQSIETSMFGPNNMLPNTFNINYKFSNEETYKGYIINYMDEDNFYLPAQVKSKDNLGKYKEIDYQGVTSYQQAWRESQYLQAVLESSNQEITFDTHLIGNLPFFGDLISVNHDLPSWGSGGFVTNKQGTTITTNEPLDFSGTAPFYIKFLKPDGGVSGPHQVTQGSNEYECILNADVTDFSFIFLATNENPTMYQFGDSLNYYKPCIVTNITPKNENTEFTITCVPYIASNHTADTGTPPAKDSTVSATAPLPPDISGLKLTNTPNSGVVVVNWNPLQNIDNYKVQKSTDNQNWTDVSTPTSPTQTISATGVLYVRVASVVNLSIGNYNSRVVIAS